MRFITLTLCWFMLTSCGSDDEWKGFLYPNKNDLARHELLGDFKSLEECRFAAQSRGGGREGYDYECGLNCKLEAPGGDFYVCKETLR